MVFHLRVLTSKNCKKTKFFFEVARTKILQLLNISDERQHCSQEPQLRHCKSIKKQITKSIGHVYGLVNHGTPPKILFSKNSTPAKNK